ncbi:MAG: NfeD family protein [Actinomycetota bacterium]
MAATVAPRRGSLFLLTLIALGVLALGLPAASQAVTSQAVTSPAGEQSNVADYVEVGGVLDSSAVSFLLRQITFSREAGSALMILRVDTPGALDAPVGPVLHAMAESTIPILVWVAPGDAEAGSAGALLALAGHLTVMSPGATVGPAHPIDLRDYRGEDAGDDGSATEAIREVAADAGRELSNEAVRRLVSDSISAEEAVDMGIADGIEPTVQELLQSIRGVEIPLLDGSATVPDAPLTLRFVKMGLLERLVHSAMLPEYAYLLLLIGFFGLIFEMYNPGLGAGGIAGTIALGFSFYSFTALPVSWIAVALLILAIVLLTWDLSRGTLAILSILGVASLVAGTLLLYRGAHPAVRLSWWAAAGGIVLTLLFFVSVMTSAIRARTAKPLPGSDGILEAVGVARTDIAPDGQVMARGTLWRARTLGAAIGQGTAVKIKGISGLMLMVEPTHEAPAQSDIDTPVDIEED